ncbi:MAG TPA: quinone-dependent dihydroorotate dehydrogenase [Patescibacteria group bacterium]|nr:quinone-dependent dihydroorotate dehydrogenase [Patescibacteria group bacterium]
MIYEKIIRPIFFRFDPETIHHFVIKFLGLAASLWPINFLIKKFLFVRSPVLKVKLGRIELENPVGLAAGFDKFMDAPQAYPMLGFGHAELGSFTLKEQPGNPRPRLWRLPKDKALIVYYGLANCGIEKMKKLFLKLKVGGYPYGISIAPNNDLSPEEMVKNYFESYQQIYEEATYITLNVSCPNVAKCELFAQINFIEDLLQKVSEFRELNNIQKDIFVKIGPDYDLAELDKIIDLCLKYKLTGVVATNLVKKRDTIQPVSTATELNHPGGISGKLLQQKSDKTIEHIYRRTRGALKIIGLGGIFTAEDAYRKIKLGANAVQVITGFIYEGPLMVRRLNRGLLKLLKKDNFKTLEEAVGSGVRN